MSFVVVVPMYFVVGGVVMAGRELLAGATRRARKSKPSSGG